MTKYEYLSALKNALMAAGVRDYSEVVREYEEHFDKKAAEGFSEAETAMQLASPEAIAGQFKEIGAMGGGRLGGATLKNARTLGVVLCDILVAPLLLMLLAWVLALYALTLAGILAGASFFAFSESVGIGGFRFFSIPEMPYISAFFVGFSFLAFAALAFVSATYCRIYSVQMLRKYLRWHHNAFGRVVRASPPLPLHPWVTPRKRRALATVMPFAAVILIIALAAAYASMYITTGSMTPWRAWELR